MKDYSAEFDISVLTTGQQEWLLARAQNHHFDTVMLDRINDEGAWLTILYDDGMLISFFVMPIGTAEFLAVRHISEGE